MCESSDDKGMCKKECDTAKYEYPIKPMEGYCPTNECQCCAKSECKLIKMFVLNEQVFEKKY